MFNLSEVEFIIPTWLANWFTFFILFNNFMPISLYVTVEMVNFMQAFFMDGDIDVSLGWVGISFSSLPSCRCPCLLDLRSPPSLL